MSRLPGSRWRTLGRVLRQNFARSIANARAAGCYFRAAFPPRNNGCEKKMSTNTAIATTAKRGTRRVKHPGVYLVRVHSRDGGAPWLHLKHKDAATGKTVKVALRTRDEAFARQAAVALSARLRHDRDTATLRKAAGVAAVVVQHGIAEEAERYHAALAQAPHRQPHTLAGAARALRRFHGWAAEQGYTTLNDLSPARLAAFVVWLKARQFGDGRVYKASTVDTALNPVRAMLRVACAAERCTSLTSDTLREALRGPAVKRRRDKALHGLKTASPLSPSRLKALFAAALQFDRAARVNANPCATDLALLVLCGFRRGELAQLRVRDVTFSAAEYATIHVPPHAAKGYEQRWVHMRGFTVMCVELLEVIVAGRGPDEWLSRSSYEDLGRAPRRLARFGGEDLGKWTCHELRATTDTYQLALGRIDLKRTTARMGHTLAVADASYLEPLDGMSFGAETLEAAMCLEPELRAVIAAERKRTDVRDKPRACYPTTRSALQLTPPKPGKPRKGGV